MNIEDIKNNTIIICSSSEKKSILKKLNSVSKLLSIKFYNKSDFFKSLTFSYDEKTCFYITNKYNVKPSIAKTYLENIYYVENKKYNSKKLDFLVNLKEELLNEKLLIINDLFEKSLIGKDIIFYNLPYIDAYEQKLINKISSICNVKVINKETKFYKHNVIKFNKIEDEVEYVAERICYHILNGVDINNIKIIIKDKEYIPYIKRIFKFYNIPVNLEEKICLYHTIAASYLIENFDSDITKVYENIKEKFDLDIVNKLATVINKFTFEDDKNLIKDLLIDTLKNTYLNEEKYVNAVNISSIDSINEDDFAFLLGFNQKSYPEIYKDEDYLIDKEKIILGLLPSYTVAKQNKEYLIKSINNIKNLEITYKLQSASNSYLPSVLISEMNLNEVDGVITHKYSNKANKIKLCSLLDKFYKYNEESDELKTLYNLYKIDYLTYNNKYKLVSFDLLNKLLKDNLKLSYSSMENYNECAFRFYLGNILKLDIYDDNFSAFLGSIFHYVLELGLTKEIDVQNVVNEYISQSKKVLSYKELFYVEKMKDEMILTLDTIKKQMEYSTLKDIKTENEFEIIKNGKLSTIFKGFIDKIIYKEIEGKVYTAIIDYKTYDVESKMDLINYGLHLQLPIYMYLIKNNIPNCQIIGFYIQKVFCQDNKYSEDNSLEKRKIDNLKLSGYSNSDENIIKLLDYNFRDSKVIKSLKVKNDGNFYSYSKVLSNEQMDKIYDKVDKQIQKTISNIENCNFDINPKIYNEKNISCTFCKFKDICFKTPKDEVIIEKEDNDGLD